MHDARRIGEPRASAGVPGAEVPYSLSPSVTILRLARAPSRVGDAAGLAGEAGGCDA